MRLLKVLSLAVALCASVQTTFADEQSGGARWVEIRLGQERKFEGHDLRIAFDRVSEDSRCPEGAKCIWQGNARIHLIASNSKGECAEFDLNTGVQPFEYQFGEYTIKLRQLAPHPSVNGELRPGDYTVTVVVFMKKKE